MGRPLDKDFFLLLHVFSGPRRSRHPQNGSPKTPRWLPRRCQDASQTSKKLPRSLQDRPRCLQDGPRRAQYAPRRAGFFSGLKRKNWFLDVRGKNPIFCFFEHFYEFSFSVINHNFFNPVTSSFCPWNSPRLALQIHVFKPNFRQNFKIVVM